jgi:hypothetical protein
MAAANVMETEQDKLDIGLMVNGDKSEIRQHGVQWLNSVLIVSVQEGFYLLCSFMLQLSNRDSFTAASLGLTNTISNFSS